MDDALRATLADLYADGGRHDGAEADRRRRRRNLEPETAELLAMILRAAAAQRVVEIGTANGYSTIWLADAARDTGGRVTTVDVEEWPGLGANLERAGVRDVIDVHRADGGAYLASVPDGSVDLLFLDAERVEYPGWWPHPARVVRSGGLLAVDNVLSHPDEVAEFLALVDAEAWFDRTTVRVGKGLTLAWRRPAGAPGATSAPSPHGRRSSR
ncbi:O-methyltransferase [Cryptosporangium minutisporangium]|uniref:Class I SAM-dependent methyltransferase n=1 Tax=Cryptosporangium minutisporangium TaxID=113569 RepID=A0ABP6TBK0_9ACTN